MFTRKQFVLPVLTGNWAQDGPTLYQALKDYVQGLESKNALRIGQAQLYVDQGLQFPATQVASSDVNNLDDYKEGTWTPTDTSGAGLTLTVNKAKYTKLGRLVTVHFDVTYPVTANGSAAQIGGFPYAEADHAEGVVISNSGASVCQVVGSTGAFFNASGTSITNANLSGLTIRSTVSLMV